ncbi:MAG: hypothetical protein AAF708_18725 [Deinococcota bacterium]
MLVTAGRVNVARDVAAASSLNQLAVQVLAVQRQPNTASLMPCMNPCMNPHETFDAIF